MSIETVFPSLLAVPKPPQRRDRNLHSSRAYRELKQRIVTGKYPGGSQFLEEQLAAELGISRTPLKEALLNLQSEGLVRVIPRRGVMVVPLTAIDIIEIFSVLEAVEDLAIRLIGERKDSRDEIDAMQADCDEMLEALQRDDLDAWVVADERFHGRLVAASRNTRLAHASESLLTQSQRFRLFTLRLRPKPIKSTRNHTATVKAMRAGDFEKARAIHAGQKKNWREDMLAMLKKFNISQI